MNKRILSIGLVVIVIIILSFLAVKITDTTEDGPITDKRSQNISIGNQVWKTENLNVDSFCSGDKIPEAKNIDEWKAYLQAREPAFCHYGNDDENGKKYGKLYNWYAVNDPRGLAPKGWHIPSEEEWLTLFKELGGKDIAGAKMKAKKGWYNGNGTNSSKFTALPGGYRSLDGDFDQKEIFGYWWSSTEKGINQAQFISIGSRDGEIVIFSRDKSYGLSVRCVKDY